MQAPRLERYEVGEEIGRGGMSVVYRGRDRTLNREVAIKVLHHFLAADLPARRRLCREAQAVARLAHPGIVEVYDSSGPEAEEAFLITELIRGKTLRAWLDDHGAPAVPEIGALIILELARILGHAHDKGVLHRDLKPENVMVTETGSLKLMDFGIAQIADGCTRYTATGTLLGSPAHMAPEIIDGGKADHRSDIFSLGTVLYWVLTGRMPFHAPNPSALFHQILEGRYEPPQLFAPKVGNGLARVVEQCLEPDRDARYPDVQALIADLEAETKGAGLDDPAVLGEALREPQNLARRHAPRLLGQLLEQGKAALDRGDIARALDRANRVLVYAPEHREGRALLARATRQRPTATTRPLLWAGAGVSLAAATFIGFTVQARDANPPLLEELNVSTRSSPFRLVMLRSPPPPPREHAPTRRGGPNPRARSKPRPSSVTEAVRAPKTAPSLPPPADAAPMPALLRVRIGQSFATIRLNGQTHLEDSYRGDIHLEPGLHEVEVVKPGLGRFRPRTIEVTARGELLEHLPGGRRRPLVGGVIDFRVPLSADEAERTPGWIPG